MGSKAWPVLWGGLISAAAGGFFFPSPAGAELENALVSPSLISDASAIVPGRAFRLGILLEMQEGCHVYWKNPGDAGLATSVEFRLPGGLRAGPLHWPTPSTFRQPGDIVGYGYAAKVLLWTRVEVADDFKPAGPVDLRADVSWLACKDACVPGEKSLVLPLATATSPRKSPAGELFDRWASRLPVPAASSPLVADWSVSGAIDPASRSGRFACSVTWKSAPESVELFPAAGTQLAIDGAEVKTSGAATSITFPASRLGPTGRGADVLELIVVAVADSKRHGVIVQVPLNGSPRPGPAPGADPKAQRSST